MNPTSHLRKFFKKTSAEKSLNASHLSVYLSLFHQWSENHYKNPISISRAEIMEQSRIKSRATYHKCLKMLHELQYISYKPSFHPFKGSQVIINSWKQSATHKKNKQIHYPTKFVLLNNKSPKQKKAQNK